MGSDPEGVDGSALCGASGPETGDAVHPDSLASWRERLGPRLIGELALVGGLLILYREVRTLTRGDIRDAFANARSVIDLQRWVGLSFEDEIQRWALASPTAIRALNHYYVWMHFPVAIGLLLWMYRFKNSDYRAVRNQLAVVTFAALALHLAFPLAPPRLMPGFVDTMRRFGPTIYPADLLEGTANQIAAMPSLHFGWSLIAALAVIRHSRHRIRHVAVIHPVVMTLTIIATANHWWLDALAAMVIIIGVALVQRHRSQATRLLLGLTRQRRPSSVRC